MTQRCAQLSGRSKGAPDVRCMHDADEECCIWGLPEECISTSEKMRCISQGRCCALEQIATGMHDKSCDLSSSEELVHNIRDMKDQLLRLDIGRRVTVKRRYGMAWHSVDTAQHGIPQHDMAWHGMGTAWLGISQQALHGEGRRELLQPPE